MDDRTPAEVQADNLDVFMEQGPRLSFRYGTYCIARYPSAGLWLLGGLGGMGIGVMWMTEPGYEVHEDGSVTDPTEEPGYAEAQIVESDEEALALHWTFQGHEPGGYLHKFRKDAQG